MGVGHGHGHGHGHSASRAADRKRLRWVLAVTGTVLVVEVVGAWITGSLALLADAGHMATDAGAVVLALGASYVAARPGGARSTFGYHRVEVVAALVNAVVLLGVCGYLAWTASPGCPTRRTWTGPGWSGSPPSACSPTPRPCCCSAAVTAPR